MDKQYPVIQMEIPTNLEVYVTMTLIVSSLSVISVQGQSYQCDRNTRPHPMGICGSRLVRAHSNLCFLLSQTYPEYFPGKRSVDTTPHVSPPKRQRHQSIRERIYSIPLSVLAELDLTKDDWSSLVYKRQITRSVLREKIGSIDFLKALSLDDYDGKTLGDLLNESKAVSKPDTEDLKETAAKLNHLTAMLLESMAKHRQKRRAPESNMVCDCCYNRCTPRQLATYC